MPRTMYDSIRAAGMPPGGDLYCCYTDGLYANEAAVRAAFPGKPIVRISALGRTDADVIDIEPGCVWPPAAAASWLASRPDATIYCGLANLAAVVAALGTKHSYWVAHYTNTPHVCTQARCGFNMAGAYIVGTQYGGDSNAGGYHFDVSAIYDNAWPGSGAHMAQGGGTAISGADIGGALQPQQEEEDMTPEEHAALLDTQANANAAYAQAGQALTELRAARTVMDDTQVKANAAYVQSAQVLTELRAFIATSQAAAGGTTDPAALQQIAQQAADNTIKQLGEALTKKES